MRNTLVVFKRELAGYFATPVAYVFLVIWLLLNGVFTFYVGDLYGRGQADLVPFFNWHPWLYLFLIPALSMRLWAEERRAGTLELLMTLPVPIAAAILGKFLAAWAFTAIALVLTFPVWITVNYLGDPDNGVIVAGYVGSLLLAGGYLAIGACMSALTRSQVIAFVLSVAVCFLFLVAGLPMVLELFTGWAPQALIEAVSGFSFLGNFNDIMRGVIDFGNLIYFATLIAFWLFANAVALDTAKSA